MTFNTGGGQRLPPSVTIYRHYVLSYLIYLHVKKNNNRNNNNKNFFIIIIFLLNFFFVFYFFTITYYYRCNDGNTQ